MKQFLAGFTAGVLASACVLAVQARGSPVTPAVPASLDLRIAPAILSLESQQVLARVARERWIVSHAYWELMSPVAVQAMKEPQVAAAASYMDVLAAAEIMAQRWLQDRGARPTRDHYVALFRFLSWGLGCPPKPEGYERLMLEVRDRLVARAFWDASKQADIRRRLKELEPGQVTAERLVNIRADQLIDLSGLR